MNQDSLLEEYLRQIRCMKDDSTNFYTSKLEALGLLFLHFKGHPEVCYESAKLFLEKLKDYSKAEKIARFGLKQNPSHVGLQTVLQTSLEEQKYFKKAFYLPLTLLRWKIRNIREMGWAFAILLSPLYAKGFLILSGIFCTWGIFIFPCLYTYQQLRKFYLKYFSTHSLAPFYSQSKSLHSIDS